MPFEPQPPDVALVRRLDRFPAMAHWRISDTAPRFRIVHQAKRTALLDEQRSSFFSASIDPDYEVLLELPADNAAEPGIAEPENRTVWPAGDSVVPVVESPSTLVLRATCGYDGGWLVVNDAWAKGWIATVDGIDVPVERANGIVRAVRLNPGSQIVKLEYRPRSLAIGSLVTCLATAITVLGLCLGRGRRSKPRELVT